MSCDSHRQYFEPSDMAMIERVLVHANLRQSSDNVALSCGPAKFLIRKFQEGMTEEDALSAALDRYLQTLQAWRSRPHYKDDYSDAPGLHGSGRAVTGERQMRAEKPVMVISDLLGAANELGRLTDYQRAKLLQRAAACVSYSQKQLNWPNSRNIDADGCDIAFDLAAMASAIDLFDAAETAKMIRRAVAIIGTLLDEAHPAPAEITVVAPLTIGSVLRALRDLVRRVISPQRHFDGGETVARF